MEALCPWLVLLMVCLPIVEVLCALTLMTRCEDCGAVATACVRFGMLGSFVLAMLLLITLVGELGSQHDSAVWRMGASLELSGPRPLRVEWAWHANVLAAGWAAALSGLAWLTLSAARHDERAEPRVALAVTAGMLHAAVVALMLSTSFVQMLFCWGAISLATWLMVGWVSKTDAASLAIRKTVVTGLATDGFLVLAVLLMVATCGTFAIDEVLSVEGLEKLGYRSPALPGFIGCLLVLGVLGRSGLFPCFGWHHGAAKWDRPVWRMIYLVGYVPSAVWLLFRFQPLLAASDVSLSMLGGLSTLAAVLSAFVACGQVELRSANAFLVTAQIGVAFTALSAGLFDVEVLRAWWIGSKESAPRAADVGRVLLAQISVIAGAFVVRRMSPATSPSPGGESRSLPLAQLSRQRLYIDDITQIVIEGPLRIWIQLAQFVDRLLTEGLFPFLCVHLPGWFGRQLESLHISRVEFDLAATLLCVATVLLTLVLVT